MRNYLITILLLTTTSLLTNIDTNEPSFTSQKQDPAYITQESPKNASNTLIFNVDQRQIIETKNELATHQIAENPAPKSQKKSGRTSKIIAGILGGAVIAGGVALTAIGTIIEESFKGMPI